MMSIRTRLVLLCLTLALLPAIPVSFVVNDMIDRSFDVGLSGSVSDALEGGMAISRKHLERLREDFEHESQVLVVLGMKRPGLDGSPALVDTAFIREVVTSDSPPETRGFLITSTGTGSQGGMDHFSSNDEFKALIAGRALIERDPVTRSAGGLRFFETSDRALMIALYPPDQKTNTTLLIYSRTDPGFIADAQRLVETGQGFAGLRAVENRLTTSFLLSFLIIYAAVAALTFLAALLISERFAAPVRHLAAATSEVAAGNWDIRVENRTGGEIGKLVDGFNDMVAELDSQQRRLTDLEKMTAWRDFARHLAHEIKNPLLPIRLTVREMRDRYDDSDEEYGRFLAESDRIIDEELEHLQRLVREFSTFAKMPGLSPTKSSLEKLAADVGSLYTQADIDVDAASAPPQFPFDADQMRRVIVNLFENAIGMMPEGAKADIKVGVTRDGDNAVLTVTDNGPGIPEKDLGRVFEPYFSKRSGGTGLGLAMVKNIILLHGGTIKAESPGGAKFTITLPLASNEMANNTEE